MRKRLTSKGFTLIELLIALAILASIVAIIYGSYTVSISSMNDARERMDIYRTARLTLERMSQDIGSAFSAPDNEILSFVGKSAEEGADTLTFISVAPGIFEDSPGKSDVSRIRYYLEKDAKGRTWLMREVKCLQADDSSKGQIAEIADGIRDLTFRYYDGKEWQKEWGSEKELKLPAAVEINLGLEDKENKVIRVSTVVHIPLARLSQGLLSPSGGSAQ